MRAVWYRTRSELRHRWRATVLLALLVGLIGGVVLTTVAGARRSSSAYERFRAETLAADLDISPSDPDPVLFEEIRRLPQVTALATTAYPFITPQGSGLYPFVEFLAVVGQDPRFGTVIDRPRVVDGRMPEPERSDEMAITDRYAEEGDLAVGDEVTFESYAPDQVEMLFGSGGAGEPAGPVVILTITGVIEAPDFLSESLGSFQPRAFLSPAFYRENRNRMGIYPGGARVRLRGGASDVPAVTAAVRQLYPNDPELEFQAAAEIDDKIADSLRALVTGLLLCALCAGLAGAVVVGQALSRHVAPEVQDARGLAALGMTRRQRMSALWAGAIPVAVGGALLSVSAAVAASPLMPIGLARQAEPDPGMSADLTVLVTGCVGVVIVVAALAALPAWVMSGSAGRSRAGERLGSRRPSAVRRAISRAGLPPSGSIGVGMALDPGRGATSAPVRSALAGVAFGVAGLVAVVVFAASLTTLVDSPPRYGFPWDALVAGFDGDIVEQYRDDLAADPDVHDLGVLTTGLARIGGDDVNIHAFETLKGAAGPTLLAGRLPSRTTEVALGSGTLRDAGLELGDTVEMTGPGDPVELTVVGRAAFPVIDDRSSVERGAALTPNGLAPLATPESLNYDLLVTWAPGIAVDAANQRLEERTGSEVFGERLPAEVNNLRLVEAMPRAMAVVLAGFAALAAVHALVTTVRRRRHDLAMLRTFGFVGRQLATTLVWQATTLAAMGLLAGVPLGTIAGRLAWRAVARSIGVVDQPEVPILTLAVIAALALVVVNLAAVLPARAAKRIPPAAILRTG